MSDPAVVHIGENSPEEVAFKLLRVIGAAEGKALASPTPQADREWILKTYAQCLLTVNAPGNVMLHLEALKP
ncbi:MULTISPECIES: hypothetical protein [unclassified Bradyrhizobium]|uniref:hypothetical protein n=1 Tax=unclassified Bradyrhizobium TaxID=2631580 RepID=UPI002916DA09|nr:MULTISPECIES: hypothetical protein [unclassified Bradyrhizobium]